MHVPTLNALVRAYFQPHASPVSSSASGGEYHIPCTPTIKPPSFGPFGSKFTNPCKHGNGALPGPGPDEARACGVDVCAIGESDVDRFRANNQVFGDAHLYKSSDYFQLLANCPCEGPMRDGVA